MQTTYDTLALRFLNYWAPFLKNVAAVAKSTYRRQWNAGGILYGLAISRQRQG